MSFIDFNQFFEPQYNLRLLGDNIFFRSLNGDIEAYGDLDLTIDFILLLETVLALFNISFSSLIDG